MFAVDFSVKFNVMSEIPCLLPPVIFGGEWFKATQLGVR